MFVNRQDNQHYKYEASFLLNREMLQHEKLLGFSTAKHGLYIILFSRPSTGLTSCYVSARSASCLLELRNLQIELRRNNLLRDATCIWFYIVAPVLLTPKPEDLSSNNLIYVAEALTVFSYIHITPRTT